LLRLAFKTLRCLAAMACMLCMSSGIHARVQELPDSLVSSYDSIQDARFRNFGGKTGARMNRLEEGQSELSAALDSAGSQLLDLQDSLEAVLNVQSVQQARLDSLHRVLDESLAALSEQADGMRRTGRITAAVFLTLLLGSSGMLLLMVLRTSNKLERHRRKQKKSNKALSVAIGEQDRRFDRKFRALKKSVRRERKKLRRKK